MSLWTCRTGRQPRKRYDHAGIPGCVTRRELRIGTAVQLLNAEQAGYEPAFGRWVLLCETHGQSMQVDTLADAYDRWPAPAEVWARSRLQRAGLGVRRLGFLSAWISLRVGVSSGWSYGG